MSELSAKGIILDIQHQTPLIGVDLSSVGAPMTEENMVFSASKIAKRKKREKPTLPTHLMDKRLRKKNQSSVNHNQEFEEVSSTKWEFVNLTEQEEDLVYRMHKLVGNRREGPWSLVKPIWRPKSLHRGMMEEGRECGHGEETIRPRERERERKGVMVVITME
ncbi:hypothetical protein R6Q59_006372 [Mikania micrantha]